VALIDITLKGSDGLDLIKHLRRYHRTLPVLVISMHDEALYAERVLRAGARGYVMKQEPAETIIYAIRRVLLGELYVSDKMMSKMVGKLATGVVSGETSPLERLSDRELEVLQLIGQGQGTRQIAERLHLSVKTVESHRTRIKEKLQFRTTPELVQYAIRWVYNAT
jgi:DNA-binding NarL/FixJ family response regulator